MLIRIQDYVLITLIQGNHKTELKELSFIYGALSEKEVYHRIRLSVVSKSHL